MHVSVGVEKIVGLVHIHDLRDFATDRVVSENCQLVGCLVLVGTESQHLVGFGML